LEYIALLAGEFSAERPSRFPPKANTRKMVTDNKRELYRGVDDGWTRAMELVLTPVLAGAIGFGIDHFAGTFIGDAAASGVNVHLLVLTLLIAAILGDSANYAIGNFLGPRWWRHS